MTMLSKIRGLFSRKTTSPSGASQAIPQQDWRSAPRAAICPESPVAFDYAGGSSFTDLHCESDAGLEHELVFQAGAATAELDPPEPTPTPPPKPERRAPIVTPKNRNELMSELRKNYAEVIELVRKVNEHLDTQESRSTRLMDIAERVPAALEYLPEIQRQNTQVVEALDRSARHSQTSADRIGGAVDRLVECTQQQGESISALHEGLELSRKTDLELVQRLAEFRTSMSAIAETNATVGRSIERMHGSALKRDQEIVSLIEKSCKWMMIALAFVGGGVGVALVIGVLALIL